MLDFDISDQVSADTPYVIERTTMLRNLCVTSVYMVLHVCAPALTSANRWRCVRSNSEFVDRAYTPLTLVRFDSNGSYVGLEALSGVVSRGLQDDTVWAWMFSRGRIE
jgi:hypothetical protein